MQSIKQIMLNVEPEIIYGNPAKPVVSLSQSLNQSQNLNPTRRHQETSFLSASTGQTAKCIDRLFLKFAAFYGQVWRSAFKSDEFLTFTKTEWQKGLSRFSDEEVNQAIELCRESKVFPPTLPEFIGFCKQFKIVEQSYTCKEEITFLGRSAVGDANLKAIRKMLGM